MYDVSVAGPDDLAAWQDFVDRQTQAGGMHHAAWYSILAEASKVKQQFLIARNDNRVCGVLPMYLSSSLFAGRHLTTLEDGPLAEDSGAAAALFETAMRLRDQTDAQYLLFRSGGQTPAGVTANAVRKTVRRIVQTDASPDVLFSRLSSYVRRDVRRAEKRGYRIELDERLDHLDTAFYDEYATHMRHLGTPVFGRATLTAIKRHLGPQRLRLYLAMKGGEVVGGLLCIVAPSRWLSLFGVIRQHLLTDYVSYLMYWHAIAEAARSGIAIFDLGRNTPGGGVHEFKTKWPGVDREADHLYFVRQGAKVPDFSDLYQGRSLKQRVWMRLPLAATNTLGPMLRRQLPFG